MTDLPPDPRILPEPEPHHTPPKGSVWSRGLMMLIVAVLISVAQTVLHVLTLIQFIVMLIDKGKPNAQIADFGNRLGPWLAKAAAFQTTQTEAKPWPFDR